MASIAERFRVGRIFLVGDAADRVTPRGRTGVNSAVADGFDLAWKLTWVLIGRVLSASIPSIVNSTR